MAGLFGAMGLHFHFHNKKGGSVPVTLSKEQLRNIFMQYDADNNKQLSKEELSKAFEHLGAVFPSFRAKRGLKYADANGDGQIDLKELEDLVNYANDLGYTVNK
ncbi:hypothetical protein Tsubulata_049954 [Turnera subulata]|uniref:EF-hand domain-containing protein n=1 Tax=Turnera subulata TaxID=218843 RepID=A0A9Q0FT78_9ROSI|nr:hypothetical protein Tsubulata_049954 [Turnera subulata]